MKTDEMQDITLLKGNCYELIKDIPDKSVDLIITDQPYQIEGLHTGTGILKHQSKNLNHYVSQMINSNLGEGIDLKILDDFVRIMKKINIYLWCNKEQIYDYLTYFVKERKCNWEILIWSKVNVPPFVNGHFLKDKEYCLYFWEKGVRIHGNYETLKTVYFGQTNQKDKKDFVHPTIKPLDLIKKLVENSSERGGVILDTFMGSGTTGVACRELGRKFIGMEINEEYYKIAVDRINGITAKEREQKDKGQLSLFDMEE